jgi:hypothetical protein
MPKAAHVGGKRQDTRLLATLNLPPPLCLSPPPALPDFEAEVDRDLPSETLDQSTVSCWPVVSDTQTTPSARPAASVHKRNSLNS